MSSIDVSMTLEGEFKDAAEQQWQQNPSGSSRELLYALLSGHGCKQICQHADTNIIGEQTPCLCGMVPGRSTCKRCCSHLPILCWVPQTSLELTCLLESFSKRAPSSGSTSKPKIRPLLEITCIQLSKLFLLLFFKTPWNTLKHLAPKKKAQGNSDSPNFWIDLSTTLLALQLRSH